MCAPCDDRNQSHALIEQGVVALVTTLLATPDMRVLRAALAVVQSLSEEGYGRRLFEGGALHRLAALLRGTRSPDDAQWRAPAVVRGALGTILAMLTSARGGKSGTRQLALREVDPDDDLDSCESGDERNATSDRSSSSVSNDDDDGDVDDKQASSARRARSRRFDVAPALLASGCLNAIGCCALEPDSQVRVAVMPLAMRRCDVMLQSEAMGILRQIAPNTLVQVGVRVRVEYRVTRIRATLSSDSYQRSSTNSVRCRRSSTVTRHRAVSR
jgi:hypothetical protein